MRNYYFMLIFIGLVLTAPVRAEDLTHVQLIGCHDGDTCAFNVLLPPVIGGNVGVRLAGIDTPEIHGKCDHEKERAIQAREFLSAQLAGAQIVLADVSRDKFFRIDATVIANGVNINALMVERGYAVPYHGSGPRHDWCHP